MTSTVDRIMEQAQVYASAWSLVGGQFDQGQMLGDAEAEKETLRQMLRAAFKSQEEQLCRSITKSASVIHRKTSLTDRKIADLIPLMQAHWTPPVMAVWMARAVERAHGIHVRCPYCDDTGSVHGTDGEWRGVCTCPAAADPASIRANPMCRGES